MRQASVQRSRPRPCPTGAGTRKRVLSPGRQRPSSAAASKRSCVSPASEAALAKAVTGVTAGAGSNVQMSAASAAEQTLLPHLPLTILRNGETMEVAVQVPLRLRACCRQLWPHILHACQANDDSWPGCCVHLQGCCSMHMHSSDVRRAAHAFSWPCSERCCECAWLQVGLEAGQGTTRLVHWCGAQLQASTTVSCWKMFDCGGPLISLGILLLCCRRHIGLSGLPASCQRLGMASLCRAGTMALQPTGKAGPAARDAPGRAPCSVMFFLCSCAHSFSTLALNFCSSLLT